MSSKLMKINSSIERSINFKMQQITPTPKRLLLTSGPSSTQFYNTTTTKLNGSTTCSSSRHHLLGPKITETLKRKLSLGAKILQAAGGMERIFKRLFNTVEGERLLKASHCHLFTTAGPIAGLLFITTHKASFCSDRKAVAFSSSATGESMRFYYKVSIPLSKVESASESENVDRPAEKYLQVVTRDGFEFWFMGFRSCRKTIKCFQRAIAEAG